MQIFKITHNTNMQSQKVEFSQKTEYAKEDLTVSNSRSARSIDSDKDCRKNQQTTLVSFHRTNQYTPKESKPSERVPSKLGVRDEEPDIKTVMLYKVWQIVRW